jgi:aminoglycoside 6'-N-acetyltransferase
MISFRPLTRADFPLLRAWLDEPLVHRWWNHETSDAALERDFGVSIDGSDMSEVFVALHEGRPFGLIQRYPIAAYDDFVEQLTPVCEIGPGALSVDYLIGEPALRGRGLGAAMIAQLVAESWAAYPDASQVLVPVAAGNRASWRALERAGFARVAEGEIEPDNPIDPPDHVVYAVSRPAAPDPRSGSAARA